MTSRGPFRPKTFYDSINHRTTWEIINKNRGDASSYKNREEELASGQQLAKPGGSCQVDTTRAPQVSGLGVL